MTRREWLQLSAITAASRGLCPPLAFADEPAKAKSPDEMIHAYLAAEVKRISARFMDGAKTKDEWEKARPRLKREFLDMLGLWPLPEKTPLKADGHRHARAQRRDHREAALPEQAGAVRHRQPVLAQDDGEHGETPRDPLRLRPLRPRPRRQQDRLPGSRHVVRHQRLRLPRRRHAATRRDRGHASRHLSTRAAGGGTIAATRRPASSAGTASAASTTSSRGPTSMPRRSASPASPAAARRPSGSPRPTSASRSPSRSAA